MSIDWLIELVHASLKATLVLGNGGLVLREIYDLLAFGWEAVATWLFYGVLHLLDD
jgi:hypothetical protein